MFHTFDKALALVLAHEGGFSDHPRDPGGATNRGVTQRTYDAWRRRYALPPRPVRQITDDELKAIYRRQYWDPVQADDLPAGLDYAVFDYAVHSGPSRAVKDLQRVVGVRADGIVGSQTLAAVHQAAEDDELAVIAQLCDRRMAFMRGLKTWHVFGKGWTRRVIGNEPGAQDGDIGVIDYATMIALGDATYGLPKAIGSRPGEVNGRADPAEAAPSATPEAVGGGVATIGTIGTLLLDMVRELMPATSDLPALKYVLVALIVAGVGLTVWGAMQRLREAGEPA